MTRPLLLCAPEVRAVLREIEVPGTGKRMHRVVLPDWLQRQFTDVVGDAILRRHPHQKGTGWEVGDRLWVRETWAVGSIYDGVRPRDINPSGKPGWCGIRYAATDERIGIHDRSAAHMPRWASRITLHVTEVRVERLQSISEEDAEAEGIERWPKGSPITGSPFGIEIDQHCRYVGETAAKAFQALWQCQRSPDAWSANPWCAVLTIRPVLANIDAPETVAAIPATAMGGGMTKEG